MVERAVQIQRSSTINYIIFTFSPISLMVDITSGKSFAIIWRKLKILWQNPPCMLERWWKSHFTFSAAILDKVLLAAITKHSGFTVARNWRCIRYAWMSPQMRNLDGTRISRVNMSGYGRSRTANCPVSRVFYLFFPFHFAFHVP